MDRNAVEIAFGILSEGTCRFLLVSGATETVQNCYDALRRYLIQGSMAKVAAFVSRTVKVSSCRDQAHGNLAVGAVLAP